MPTKCTNCNVVWNNLKIDYDSDEQNGVCPKCCSSLDLVETEELGYIYHPLLGTFTNDTKPQQVFIYTPIKLKKAREDTGLSWEEKQKLRIAKEDAAIEAYAKNGNSTEEYFNTIKS